jgi:integrase
MDKNMSEPTQTNRKKSRRRNGDGNTYRYKNGWRTVISHKGYTVTAMGRSEQESRRLAKEKVKSLPIFDGSLVPAAAKLTTGEFLVNWINKKHKSSIAATTHRRYASLINIHIIPALGNIKLQAVTKNHVNALMLQMRENGQSARSQQQARAVLSAAFESAMEDDLVASNPVVKSRTITLDTAQIHPLSLAEVQTLLAKTTGVHMQARVRMAVLYAMRQGEALGLQWKDVDFNKKTVFIWQQVQKIDGSYEFVKLKSEDSVRTLEIDDETLAALKAHKIQQNMGRLAMGDKWKDHDLVFSSALGKPIDCKTDYRQWHRVLAAAGLPKKRLHDARHTAATLLFDQGLDIEVIRRFMGHSSVLLTSKTYVHHSSRQLRGAADLIQRMSQSIEIAI